MQELAKALPALMAEMENAKNTKSGYGYNYAPLNEILETVRPILAKHRFSVVQMVGHEEGLLPSGQCPFTKVASLESTMALPPAEVKGTNEVQQMGASITYARRYMLTSLLGIAGEEDTDGVPPAKREAKKRESQPAKVEDLTDRLKTAEKMTYALLEKGKFTDDEKANWIAELETIEAMPDNEEKYKSWRSSQLLQKIKMLDKLLRFTSETSGPASGNSAHLRYTTNRPQARTVES